VIKMNNVTISPILKRRGGKRKLLKYIIPKIPREMNNYFEPFAGGGAVFLCFQPQNAYINDLNEELINVYLTIKNHPQELLKCLKLHKLSHNKEYYYKTRSLDRGLNYKELSSIEKAARIIYLNHTCYNGLYRVNKKGYFNTPIGRYKNPKILNEDNILNANKYFNNKNVIFSCGDYKDILKKAEKGDFVYFDPPYDPVSVSASFTMYTSNGFSRKDQTELKELCDELTKKGVKFLLSNSETVFIKDLYKNYNIELIPVRRLIGSNNEGRKIINEVLISNY